MFCLKGYTMYYGCVSNQRFKWKELLNFSGDHIYRHDSTPTAYNRVCSTCLSESLNIFIKSLIMQLSSFCIAMSGPVLGLLQGSRVTLFSVRLPILNQYPDIEYITNMAWEILNGILGLFCFLCMEAKFNIVNDAVNVSSDLSVCDLNNLSTDIETNRGTEELWANKLKIIFMRTLRIDGYECSLNVFLWNVDSRAEFPIFSFNFFHLDS